MPAQAKQTMNQRLGYTLMELLVVITVMMIIIGLGVYVVVRTQDGASVKQSATQVQGMVLTMKQRAVRDRRATGIRLIFDGPGVAMCHQIVGIQQPDDAGANGVGTIASNGSNTCTISGADTSSMQAGDYLELNGGGLLHKITQVNNSTMITLASNVPGPATTYYNYRVIRQAELIPGLQPLQLSSNVGLDLSSGTSAILNLSNSSSTAFPTSSPATSIDILFTPSGSVQCRGTVGDRLVLWIRDTTQTDPRQGGTILLTITVRSGLIAAVPVDLTSGNSYSQAQDPQITGM